ncbi:heterogeneous nuclear ribonucleoprotein L-like protein [Dinothrombium tinctorium]|uniref:Heterogeneous nuclear ribonucleoprotein L-like protein n=1 Tax=Dinothrombium tinctorium TaxID=1965070 RepID=A0A3S3R2H0_9ACAR|nr:heterogeneous nuclear ribonucleoprotein L-like protein [Dinothrombium tinctorium]RWS17464.1 heterogeneous nuclear ribonucleoprotein L-like protein [Dinothrombium tinctorium]
MATYEHTAKRIKTEEDRNYNNPGYYGHSNSRYGGHTRNDERENHVLLITVINPAYPITCEVIHQICSPQGKVLRVVIFKKNGVQAMVEFDSVDSAKRAKQALHGCDIYSGCCTLRIEFAKPTRLNVYKNDNESYDYTNPSLGRFTSTSAKHTKTLQCQCACINSRKILVSFKILNNIPKNHQLNNGNLSYYPWQTSTGVTLMPLDVMRNDGRTNENHSEFSCHVFQSNLSLTGKPSDRPALLGEPQGMGNNRNNAPAHQANYVDHGEAAFHEGYGAAPRPPAPQNYVDPYMQHPPGDPYEDGRAPVLPTPPNPGFGGAPPPPPPGGGGAPPPIMSGQPPPPTGAPQQGAVMMVYGLDHDRMNAERLFNLFCLYGNVVRVKFLKSKEGCAMVQMGDPVAVERCINSLNNLTFFGKKMQLSYSKQAFLNDVQQPFELQDGTPSFKDFMGNRNNRFTNPEAASKNRIAPPAKVLHFFNAPHGMTEEEIVNIFKSTGGPTPSGVKLFQSKTERSSSGLIQFESVAEAVEALVLCNHISIPNPSGKFPFVFKLCFSSTGSRF